MMPQPGGRREVALTSEPVLTVQTMACIVPLPLDENGTPMYMGTRLIEVEPGQWAHPDAIALEKFLADAVDAKNGHG